MIATRENHREKQPLTTGTAAHFVKKKRWPYSVQTIIQDVQTFSSWSKSLLNPHVYIQTIKRPWYSKNIIHITRVTFRILGYCWLKETKIIQNQAASSWLVSRLSTSFTSYIFLPSFHSPSQSEHQEQMSCWWWRQWPGDRSDIPVCLGSKPNDLIWDDHSGWYLTVVNISWSTIWYSELIVFYSGS